MNKRLAGREFLAGPYSIADMAAYPWVVPHERQSQHLDDFPHLKRWFEVIRARPATGRAYQRGEQLPSNAPMSEEARKVLVGQTAGKNAH